MIKYKDLNINKGFILFLIFVNIIFVIKGQNNTGSIFKNEIAVEQIFNRIRNQKFHPLNEDNSLTIDRKLDKAGIADLNDEDWKVRLLAVRDLVVMGKKYVSEIKKGLFDKSIHVRQVSAMVLGILSASEAIKDLEKVIHEEKNTMVRSQAVIALGQIESRSSISLLQKKLLSDPSRDVRHQCELAIDQIEKQMGTTDKQLSAYLTLDESSFESVYAGDKAPDFMLEDTEGKMWQLSKFRNEKWVVLIWIFADWCPICHGEFFDLIKMRDEFDKSGVQVFTLEIHDTYRGKVMIGKELEPAYWFAKESFQKSYTENIYWPHLLDRAGAVGAKYGTDPLAFSVHAEYINRPTTVIIDKEGIVQLIYQGTFWGDRPTIEQSLEMIKTGNFSFEHPDRLKSK